MIARVKRVITEGNSKLRKYEVEMWKGSRRNTSLEVIDEDELMETDPELLVDYLKSIWTIK